MTVGETILMRAIKDAQRRLEEHAHGAWSALEAGVVEYELATGRSYCPTCKVSYSVDDEHERCSAKAPERAA